MPRLLVIALLACSACGGTEAAKSIPPRSEPSATNASATRTATGDEAAAATPTREATTSLPLELRVEVSSDGVGLHVLNAGGELASLSPDVSLERKQADGFGEVDAHALALRLDCASKGCVKLAPGAELVAPSWLGRIGGERCDALAKPAPGEYRLVVKSCAGTAVRAAPFVIPVGP